MAGPVRQQIDISSLERYVEQNVHIIRTPLALKQFGFGQSNPTYQITDASGVRYVMRKKPPGKLVSKSAHQVEREARIIRALENTDVPVPKIHILCEDPSIIGTAFYIMEFLDGRSITEPFIPGVSPEDRQEMWRDAVRTLVKLHKVDYNLVGLGDFGKTSDFYNRQIKTYSTISKAQSAAVDVDTQVPVGPLPHFDDMIALFKSDQPPDRATLVHGDFKMDNLIFHKTEPRVIGVLDWELATIGHPLSDFVYLTSPFPFQVNRDFQTDSAPEFVPGVTPGLPTLNQCIEWYRQGGGYDVAPDLAYGKGFSSFRSCVNMQGIAARFALRQASGADAKRYADNANPAAEAAWVLVQALWKSRGSAGSKL